MIDLDQVIGAGMDAFAVPALVTPIKSQPGQPAYAARGVFTLKGADILDGDTGATIRADIYTFGVRESEFTTLVARGDQVSAIQKPFLAGRVFIIEDDGQDGQGSQEWILKEQRAEDGEP